MNPLNDILDQDLDPTETREWTESLQSIIQHDGTERAHYLLERMVDETRRAGGHLPFRPTTEYVNTIPAHQEAKSPGDAAMEWRFRSLIRWNAMAMVVKANRLDPADGGDLGGQGGRLGHALLRLHPLRFAELCLRDCVVLLRTNHKIPLHPVLHDVPSALAGAVLPAPCGEL